jgi:NAD-dependent dihydropyrimidine dehydrogenase PreA subunit
MSSPMSATGGFGGGRVFLVRRQCHSCGACGKHHSYNCCHVLMAARPAGCRTSWGWQLMVCFVCTACSFVCPAHHSGLSGQGRPHCSYSSALFSRAAFHQVALYGTRSHLVDMCSSSRMIPAVIGVTGS